MKQKLIRLASYPILVSLFVGIVGAGIARAVTSAPVVVSDVNNLGKSLFCPIMNWMFWVLLAVTVIMVMWAAYIYLTAGDDTEKVHKATKTLTYAAVAIVVGIIAKGFPYLVMSIFPNGSATSPFDCAGS
jgi:fumarate reductase subunit D